MCYPNFTASKFVAVSIFMKSIFYLFIYLCIVIRICSSSQENKLPYITPPKQIIGYRCFNLNTLA